MNCEQSFKHIVREGESFYTIANAYQIPMEVLMGQNPGLDPYNLQVGTELLVCLDTHFPEEEWEGMDWEDVLDLSNDMRKVWEQHIYWTRMLLLSIAGRMQDQSAVTARLMRNPSDIAEVFEDFYPKETTDQLERLLTEHLQIGGKLMTAARDGNQAEVQQLLRQWYANASQLAQALASMNPQYDLMELQEMFYRHLEQLTRQIMARLAGDYQADIQAFDEGEEHILNVADYLTYGLVRQFGHEDRS